MRFGAVADSDVGAIPPTPSPPHYAPTRDRIEVLDVLRGLAILSILLMNIGMMAVPAGALFGDGWSATDFRIFAVLHVLVSGTERGLLELLFGAGVIILTARAVRPDAPIEIADIFYRRNLWLLAFGLVDVFALLWIGDILFIYALAALFLFPFRRLDPRWLLAIGLLWTGWSTLGGAELYAKRAALERRVEAGDARAAADWAAKFGVESSRASAQKSVAREVSARAGGVVSYAQYHWNSWVSSTLDGTTLMTTVIEAFSTMMIGMALWRWGVIGGQRSARFYFVLIFAAYLGGVGARLSDLDAVLTGNPRPQIIWIVDEAARVAVAIGHLALVNLLWKGAAARALLAPFVAVGRGAFSVYLLQSLIAGWWLFAPWGPDLWGRYAWGGLTGIASGMIVVLILLANLWFRYFAIGPVEWLWRSLTYQARQPWRSAPPVPLPA